MSDDQAIEAKMQAPAGQALRRIVQEEDFRDAVSEHGERALAGYEVSEEEAAALVADANTLGAEVSGFADVRLRTPDVLGAPLGPMGGPVVRGSLACYNTNVVKGPPVRRSLACYADDGN